MGPSVPPSPELIDQNSGAEILVTELEKRITPIDKNISRKNGFSIELWVNRRIPQKDGTITKRKLAIPIIWISTSDIIAPGAPKILMAVAVFAEFHDASEAL